MTINIDPAQLHYFGTEAYFREELERIDVLCQIDFQPEGFPYSVRVRPSHPRYRAALIARAKQVKTMGVCVGVVKEVDDWGACNYTNEDLGIDDRDLGLDEPFIPKMFPFLSLAWWRKYWRRAT